MNCNRRTFLGLAAATGAAGCVGARAADGNAQKFDDNLSVFVTDIHIGGKQLDGGSEAPTYTQGRLSAFVDEVLAMKPLPRRVVSFGDLAYLRGNPDDYATSKPILKRLEDAGIELVFCMGNHDRAVCSLTVHDFYFPRKPDTDKRPAVWRLKVEENKGATCTFLYDREGV